MEEWDTIEDLISEFKLRSYKYDLDSLEKELTEKRNELHPDRTGGDYKSEEQKTEYLRLCEAIDFLKEHRNKALIPISQVPAVFETFKNLFAKPFETRQAESTLRSSYNELLASHLRLPKVSSASIGVIFSVLFFFWDVLEHYQFIGSWYFGIQFRLASLSVSLLAILLFLMISLREMSDHSYMDFLLGEDGLHYLFDAIVRRVDRQIVRTGDSGERIQFSKRTVTRLLQHYLRRVYRNGRSYRRSLLKLGPGELPPKIASDCADILLEKLGARGVVQKMNLVDIDEWYEIPSDIIERSQGRGFTEREEWEEYQ